MNGPTDSAAPETRADRTIGSEAERQRLIDLQRLLLPQTLPAIGCTEAAAEYRAHNHQLHLGGDWYDLVDRPDDQVVAIVGDVVGHGVTQIGVMGQLRAAANALSRSCAQPDEVLNALDAFARDLPGAEMATITVVMLDGSTTARVASAGHPPPLLIKSDGNHQLVEQGRRPPLGLGTPNPHGTFEFSVGDLIVLYTDGLVERRTESIDDGIARVLDYARSHIDEPCRDIAAGLVDTVAAGATDDVAVLVLRPRNHRGPDFQLDDKAHPAVRIR